MEQNDKCLKFVQSVFDKSDGHPREAGAWLAWVDANTETGLDDNGKVTGVTYTGELNRDQFRDRWRVVMTERARKKIAEETKPLEPAAVTTTAGPEPADSE